MGIFLAGDESGSFFIPFGGEETGYQAAGNILGAQEDSQCRGEVLTVTARIASQEVSEA